MPNAYAIVETPRLQEANACTFCDTRGQSYVELPIPPQLIALLDRGAVYLCDGCAGRLLASFDLVPRADWELQKRLKGEEARRADIAVHEAKRITENRDKLAEQVELLRGQLDAANSNRASLTAKVRELESPRRKAKRRMQAVAAESGGSPRRKTAA